MKRYKWQEVDEESMPAEGTVLRRFVSGEQMTMARVAFAAGSVTPPHRHENEQFTMVLSGSMEFTVEGEPVLVKAGEVIHLLSNEFHGARALEDAVLLDIFSPPRHDWSMPGG